MNVATERNFKRLFPPAACERFWTHVERTLEEVFGISVEPARRYREKIQNAPTREQRLVYHAGPLKVAADLANVEAEIPLALAAHSGSR